MRHDQLVEAAARWLYSTKSCSVVITELSGGEEADAIGWRGGYSILVECKVSLSDLRRDKHKPSRRYPELGMGLERYLLVPLELRDKVVEKDLLPEGWGLLWGNLSPRGIPRAYIYRMFDWKRDYSNPHRYPTGAMREMKMLTSVIRRIAGEKKPVSGVSVRCYQDGLYPSVSRATLGVALETPTDVPRCPACGLKANEGHLPDCPEISNAP
jgi:hypothetical protein